MLNVLSLFSGIGAFEKALTNLNVPYNLVGFCEVDKYAAESYCAIHGVSADKNLGDITKVDETALAKDIDVLTYGFPCQDISISGRQIGLFDEDGALTRSGLFFEALRIIEATKPKIAIAENVKNLVSKKFTEQFQLVLHSLEAAGYNNYWQVLNAKDFGVPQNRERVFIVSIRKDVDKGNFKFPAPIPLGKRLKDVLDDEVDEKYYLSDKMVNYIFEVTKSNRQRGNGNVFSPSDEEGCAKTVTTKEGCRVKDNFIVQGKRVINVGNVNPSGRGQNGNVIDSQGLARTVTQEHGEGQKILVRDWETAKCIGGFGEKKSNGGQQFYQQDRVYQGDIALAHPASIPGGSYRYAVDEAQSMRIRKLTPKECFRLMGFDDESFHRAEAVNSNTQLYKQAGNSIVVDVLEHLFRNLLNESGEIDV